MKIYKGGSEKSVILTLSKASGVLKRVLLKSNASCVSEIFIRVANVMTSNQFGATMVTSTTCHLVVCL